MANEMTTLPEIRYRVVDRDPPVLQETELLRVKGNWHYWRCPKSGTEWHTNGRGCLWASDPGMAWWSYMSLVCYEIGRFRVILCNLPRNDDPSFDVAFRIWAGELDGQHRRLQHAAKEYRRLVAEYVR